ncbi:unnamed protein product [Diatraea saccharalis]|uniref:Uncharacterized protein n=1 Tax=Diatraea saccharalis TaxID=40085 RepID=A0A9N9R1R1_9NEOP|nr:unnamed protein product [Diatraea saccharalis]
MNVITLIFTLFVNQLVQAIVPINSSTVTELPRNATEVVFASQIQQIWTTLEVTPEASDGNDLNDIGSASSSNIKWERNIQEKSERKKYGKDDEAYNELLSSDRNNQVNKKTYYSKHLDVNEVIKRPQSLVWDPCIETKFKDNPANIVKLSSDMENASIDSHNDNGDNQNSTIWNKRDANSSNYTNAMKDWLEKYNNLLKSKTEERRQQRPESILIRKISEATTTEIPILRTTVQVIPITREIFKETAENFNITLKTAVTEISIKASYTEDWFETEDRGKIRFSGLPQKETYLIPTLKLEEGFHPFTFMSEFFTVIYPFEFPVGLVKDIVWGKFSFPYSFLQSIKVESTFLAFIIAFTCIALVIPAYLFILAVLSLFSKSRCDDETETGALFPVAEESDCNDRVLVFVTLFAIFLCCILISGMAVSNEQAHSAVMESRNVIHCACADVASWLVAAARELHHSLIPPVDLVQHAYREDLKKSEDLSKKISSLRNVSMKAGLLAAAASDRVKDLANQLDNMKKYCTVKDTPLCDTVNANALELQIKFEWILHETQLLELRTLGVENLTRAIATARKEFRILPSAITTQTIQARKDILNDIETRRQAVHGSAKVLNDIVRHLTTGLHSVARQLEASLDRVQRYDYWRWTLMLGHAEVYVCHALWDKPQYETLSALLDKPSPVLNNDEGIFDALFRELDNVTIDVSIKDVLRMNYNGPIMGRDLPSLVDQLQNIAAQISDLTTAGRLETLATRTKRLYLTNIKPLEQAKADIVYRLTELELQLLPFRRKLNISLSHIHTAQYYIDNQGDVIAQKTTASTAE